MKYLWMFVSRFIDILWYVGAQGLPTTPTHPPTHNTHDPTPDETYMKYPSVILGATLRSKFLIKKQGTARHAETHHSAPQP